MSGGSGSDGKSLEDMFYQKEMEISKTAFTRQFTHAVIYAWVKLREQVSIIRRELYRVANSGCRRSVTSHGSQSVSHRIRRKGLVTISVSSEARLLSSLILMFFPMHFGDGVVLRRMCGK